MNIFGCEEVGLFLYNVNHSFGIEVFGLCVRFFFYFFIDSCPFISFIYKRVMLEILLLAPFITVPLRQWEVRD